MPKFRLLAAFVSAAVSLYFSLSCRADLPTVTVLHTFALGGPGDLIPQHDVNTGGSRPASSLTQGPNGAFYGTTKSGGASGTGIIFKINADGTGFAVLHSFGALAKLFENETNSDGCWPTGALVFGNDGILYGTASQGGPGGSGTVFRLNPDGSGFTILHSFEPKEEMFHNNGGANPLGLTAGPGGLLFGVAGLGGNGRGLIFTLTSGGGKFHVVHSFDDSDNHDNINQGGTIPTAAVVFGRDGTLFGTANTGGKDGSGVIYKMDPDGKNYAVLHDFWRKVKDNGAAPIGSLIISPDNFLYGSTRQGGSADGGIIYKIRPDGTEFTVLHTFSAPGIGGDDGWSPSAPIFGTDGRLYGVSGGSGETGGAMLFKISADGAKFFLMHGFSREEGTKSGVALTLGHDGNLYGVSTNGGANGTGTIFRVSLPLAK